MEILAAGRRHLHGSAVPIWFLYDLGRGVVGVIPILIAGGNALWLLGAMGVGLLIAPVVRYRRFGYEIDAGALVVEGGLLSRWQRVIPRERVQSIDVVQKLRHRAFGVVELRIESAGGAQTEAALVAVRPEEADRIRRWAAGAGVGEPAPAVKDESAALARLTGKDLLVAGITGGRVAVLAVLIGYGQEFVGEDSFGRIADFAEQLMPGATVVVVIAALAAAVLVLSLSLSIALTILIYWDFTVRMEEDRLVITRGLMEKRKAQVPLRRVQAIQVNENFLRRPFGLASLSVVVAGYSSDAQDKEESSVLLPLARRERAWRLATQILGAPPDLAFLPLPRSPGRALARQILLSVLFGAMAGIAGVVVLGPRGAAGFALAPITSLFSWVTWRSGGHGVAPGYVVVRAGALVRKTSIVPEANIQHLQLTRSVLQKSFRLATVKVHIPGSNRRATDLDDQQARRWFTRLGASG